MELAGISFTTTLPAPMTEFLPMVTPGRIIEPPSIHTPSSIRTGRAIVSQMDAPGCVLSGILSASCTEWVAVYIFTSGVYITLLPIMILLLSRNVQFLSLLSLTLYLSQLLRQGNASKNRQLQIDMPPSICKVNESSREHEQTKCIKTVLACWPYKK